ncbi:MAG TPA: c-type cytochrome [Longimicrobiales bacterium]|nr:c-type cytochrome [Longimicrobiales bacterium]
MTGLRRAGAAALVACLGVGACGPEHEFEPPDREEQVAEADTLFSAAVFDTLTWPSDEARALEGNVVYSSRCRQCHGPLGRGGTDYATERDLDVSSLVEPGWEYADDPDGVRRRIFAGHPEGMPTFGVAGITPREIDATAFYILERLRPEVLGEGG